VSLFSEAERKGGKLPEVPAVGPIRGCEVLPTLNREAFHHYVPSRQRRQGLEHRAEVCSGCVAVRGEGARRPSW